jgi:hypothetical protein
MERRERLKRIIASREGELDLDLPTTTTDAGVMIEAEVAVQKVRSPGIRTHARGLQKRWRCGGCMGRKRAAAVQGGAVAGRGTGGRRP